MNRVRRIVHAAGNETAPYSGEGVTAALLDTGFALHPDIAGQLVCFRDFLGSRREPYDDCGHGTHVAGILCGNGGCSNGLYTGIAPGCRIVACKVLDAKGDGDTADMVAGIRFILETRHLYHTRILSISAGVGKVENAQLQEELRYWLCQAWQAGLLVVIAAGNRGPGKGSISPLALSPCVVAVGCHDGQGGSISASNCDLYSGRGPEGVKKPDIVAPGTGIVSCSAGFGVTPFGIIKNPYVAKSGTSMAVPAVSGAAALVWQRYPQLTNAQVRERLLYSAQDMGEPWERQGWGMLHAGRALFG